MLRDADIRDGLCDYLEMNYGKIRFFEELVVGKSRADIVLVTEEDLYGVEIKSDADTYSRLADQVKNYDRFFDRNIIVVGTSHAHHVREHVPNHWGVITVEETKDGKLDVYALREPQNSPKVKLTNQLSLLWRSELAQIQANNGLYKYPGKNKAFVKKYLLEKVPHETLKKEMLEALFDRDYILNR